MDADAFALSVVASHDYEPDTDSTPEDRVAVPEVDSLIDAVAVWRRLPARDAMALVWSFVRLATQFTKPCFEAYAVNYCTSLLLHADVLPKPAQTKWPPFERAAELVTILHPVHAGERRRFLAYLTDAINACEWTLQQLQHATFAIIASPLLCVYPNATYDELAFASSKIASKGHYQHLHSLLGTKLLPVLFPDIICRDLTSKDVADALDELTVDL